MDRQMKAQRSVRKRKSEELEADGIRICSRRKEKENCRKSSARDHGSTSASDQTSRERDLHALVSQFTHRLFCLSQLGAVCSPQHHVTTVLLK